MGEVPRLRDARHGIRTPAWIHAHVDVPDELAHAALLDAHTEWGRTVISS